MRGVRFAQGKYAGKVRNWNRLPLLKERQVSAEESFRNAIRAKQQMYTFRCGFLSRFKGSLIKPKKIVHGRSPSIPLVHPLLILSAKWGALPAGSPPRGKGKIAARKARMPNNFPGSPRGNSSGKLHPRKFDKSDALLFRVHGIREKKNLNWKKSK